MNHSDLSRNIGSTVLILVFFLILSIASGYAETIYVNSTATGANDGTSWNDAYVDLQPAIEAAAPGDEIWVAAGIYKPTSRPNGGKDRGRHFSLKNGVAIYGGFTGTETSLNERDLVTNQTILSGDIGIEGDDSDNCFEVFYHPEGTDLDTSAILDGFTITGGKAYGPVRFHEDGGGMYNHSSSPALSNCTFIGNSAVRSGGGMRNAFSSPTLTNCTFSGNSARWRGGGMSNFSSSPTLTNCTFSSNSADIGDGGGMYNDYSSSPTLTNCTFSGNSANHGGGMRNSSSSSPILANCTFSGNSADDGGGMSNSSSSPTLTNCILWNNDAEASINEVFNLESTPIFTYCDIKGSFVDGAWDEELGTNGGNNIDSDPLFVRNPGTNGEDDAGDLHLTSESTCIDAGDPSLTDGQDMDGETRVFDGDEDGIAIVDMGADEYVDADYDGIVDRDDPIVEPTDTDGDDGDSGGSNGGGSGGGCFINAMFGAWE
jgi:parallel beta-helix repeat protein